MDRKTLEFIGHKLAEVPRARSSSASWSASRQAREKMLEEDKLDWSMGELLAYGSLLLEGHPVRMTGQDVERGTFSHRHAIVKVEDSDEEHIHLKHLKQGQALFQIYNSTLSEYAVLGFESTATRSPRRRCSPSGRPSSATS